MLYICFMEKQIEDEKFLLRISPNLKSLAKSKAKEGSRSLNGYILSLIKADTKVAELNDELYDRITKNK